MPNNCNHISDPSVRVNMDSGEKTWLTPPSIIKALGHFDTDPCVPDDMPWRTADKMITKYEDGLITPWHGRVWLNPPYGKEAVPFLEKMSRHDGGGIALIFARTDNLAWHELVFPYAHSVMFIRKRIKFCDKNGVPQGFPAMPSALISYSQKDTEALMNSGINGKIIVINENRVAKAVKESEAKHEAR